MSLQSAGAKFRAAVQAERPLQVVGTINPGPNGVEIERVDIDYATWTMTIEADMPLANGSEARYVATGTLENLGSWLNRRYSGTYRHGDETGTFILALN